MLINKKIQNLFFIVGIATSGMVCTHSGESDYFKNDVTSSSRTSPACTTTSTTKCAPEGGSNLVNTAKKLPNTAPTAGYDNGEGTSSSGTTVTSSGSCSASLNCNATPYSDGQADPMCQAACLYQKQCNSGSCQTTCRLLKGLLTPSTLINNCTACTICGS